MPGSFAVSPDAELGLGSNSGVTYAWAREGTTLKRFGGDHTATFELDDRGRIVHLLAGDREEIYTFDGDMLVARQTLAPAHAMETFEYDAGGNLAIRSNDAGGYEAYDNSCW